MWAQFSSYYNKLIQLSIFAIIHDENEKQII